MSLYLQDRSKTGGITLDIIYDYSYIMCIYIYIHLCFLLLNSLIYHGDHDERQRQRGEGRIMQKRLAINFMEINE